MRKIAMWLVWNVPLGRLAPWVLGFALGRRPREVKPMHDQQRDAK